MLTHHNTKREHMLILSRRPGETLCIGDEITVTVLGYTKNNQIRIGVNAPKSTPVHREEIYQKILKEKKEETQALARCNLSA